jgi:hypothetical protein
VAGNVELEIMARFQLCRRQLLDLASASLDQGGQNRRATRVQGDSGNRVEMIVESDICHMWIVQNLVQQPVFVDTVEDYTLVVAPLAPNDRLPIVVHVAKHEIAGQRHVDHMSFVAAMKQLQLISMGFAQ